MSDKTEVSEKMKIITSKAGKLTVLETWMGAKYIRFCRVRCYCGNIFEPMWENIKSGRTKSCGCYRLGRLYKHGYGKNASKTYRTWVNVKLLCTNKNHPRYHRYGELGITFCEEWKSFENFLRDMGEKPPGFIFKRLDKDGDFEPGNCLWFPIKKKGVGKKE